MSRIFLVQSASDLKGGGGYCRGLLESDTRSVLISFVDYYDRMKRTTIHDPNPEIRRVKSKQSPPVSQIDAGRVKLKPAS